MELVKGYWIPEHDIHCRQVVFGQTRDLQRALRHVTDFTACIQAGGNWGVWANHLADSFGRVYTFEPDEENFDCLVKNIPENVIAVQAALGDAPDRVGLYREDGNSGAHRVDGEGDIPVMTIDSLKLDSCGLIVLDIEGYEPKALDGARETIEKHKPVLMIEDKGVTRHYGIEKGWTEDIPGYEIVDRVHRDVILVST